MAQKKALITGITGQDGAYLSDLLLRKGYDVYGGVRRTSTRSLWRLDELGITDKVELVDLELLEMTNILSVIREIRPTEVYNLAAQSFVGTSFKIPTFTGDVDGLSVGRLLEAIRAVNPEIKFYQASTSEMFGRVQGTPQNETTPFHPRSPYAVAKLFGHWTTVNFRESYNMFATSGILFNHESPLRGPEFVTRKITLAFAAIAHGSEEPLELGNLEAARDWGHSREYVEGMWRMLQANQADDFVLATGKTHTVEDFVNAAAKSIDLDLIWDGEGTSRFAVKRKTGRPIVRINPQYFRPAEVDTLTGDATKANKVLGWTPQIEFSELVELMIKADIDRLERQSK